MVKDRSLRHGAVSMVLTLTSAVALAQPARINPPLQQIDAGPAVPASPYFSYLLAGEDQPGVLNGLKFPIESQLKPGVLAKPGAVVLDSRWMTQPVFVLGTDDGSYLWLNRFGENLRRMGAAGIVLAAESAQAFKRIQRLASTQMLPISIGPDTWLEQQLIAQGNTVLPLLIQLDGRITQEPQ